MKAILTFTQHVSCLEAAIQAKRIEVLTLYWLDRFYSVNVL